MDNTELVEKIICGIQSSLEQNTKTLTEIKESLIRLEARVDKFEVTSTMQVKQLEKEVASVREHSKEGDIEVRSTKRHITQQLEHELQRRDEEKRKWMFYAVTVVVSFLTGGGGLALLSKLIH